MMNARLRSMIVLFLLILPFGQALADEYADTINMFREAADTHPFFDKSFGYAVFPLIGKGGYILGGAYGKGRVYRGGSYVGDTQMTQLTVGFQLGGQGYSQVIFFEDKRAFDEFTSGNFEFGVQANAVVVTAGATAQAGSTGMSASASGTQHNVAHVTPKYHKGMAVFTIVKGGLMYEASIGGQKFDYARQGEQLTRSTSPIPGEGDVTP